MDRRVLKILGILAALALVFVVGAVAGGSIVFAASKTFNPDEVQLVVPDQADPEPGVVIATVATDSPADDAGVERGDILLEIDEQAVNSLREISRYLFDLQPGDEVELKVLHGDEARTLLATLGDRDGRPYLGVIPCIGQPAQPARITMHTASPGARVIEIVPDSPAEDAGLQVGDLIISVDGQALNGEHSLADLIADYAPDDSLTLEVQSPGEEPREVNAQLGEHPEEAGVAYLGVQYLPALHMRTIEGRRLPFDGPHFEMPPFEHDFSFIIPEGDFDGGAIVRHVAEDSPAEGAGLQRGDVITSVDDKTVDHPETVVEAVADHQPGDVVTLTVYRPKDDETLEIEVTLTEHPEEEGKAYLGVFLSGVFITQEFGGQHAPPMLKGQGREYRFRLPLDPDQLPFDFNVEPHWFHFETPPNDCCDGELPDEV